MATHSFYIYTADALPFDATDGSFTFAPDYDHTEDRVLVTITDDDVFLDGDERNDEVGEDSNQFGMVTTPGGEAVARGLIYGENYAILQTPEGGYIMIDRIEVDGELIGYSPSEPMTPGATYFYVSGQDIDNMLGGAGGVDTRLTYGNYRSQSVPCFLSGTMIETDAGPLPVDWIVAGDRVMTRDHGPQTVRWRGHRTFRSHPDLPHPICIGPFALGASGPGRPVRVSPQHRILVTGPECELLFGTAEVLVAARHLVHWPGIHRVPAGDGDSYHHLLFDRHEVIDSCGLFTESLFLGDIVSEMAFRPPRKLVNRLRSGHTETARRCLTRSEAMGLRTAAFSRSA